MNRHSSKLRRGFTTGTCAAAAAKGASLLLRGRREKTVEISLPGGEKVSIAIHKSGLEDTSAFCEIIKDAGDDPDVTHGALIRAQVKPVLANGISVSGGEGVGVVTRPGLAVPPGSPAINPGPENMIRSSMQEVFLSSQGAEVIISVADGAEIAKKTLNPRLGITNGISILGTTGLVIPYSHEAYRESIQCAFDVIRAMCIDCVVLSTGRASEKEAQRILPHLPEAAFVLMADYFAFAVQEAMGHDITKITIVGFPGKLLKIASGAMCTHYRVSSVDFSQLYEIACSAGLPEDAAAELSWAHTIRHAFGLIPIEYRQKIYQLLAEKVAERVKTLSKSNMRTEVMLLAYSGGVSYYARHD